MLTLHFADFSPAPVLSAHACTLACASIVRRTYMAAMMSLGHIRTD